TPPCGRALVARCTPGFPAASRLSCGALHAHSHGDAPVARVTVDQAAAARGPGRQPRSRAGRKRIAPRKANSAENVMPTSRNGRKRSEASGQRTSASRASGQQSTKRRHQASSAISAFIADLLAACAGEDRLQSDGGQRQWICDERARSAHEGGKRATKG